MLELLEYTGYTDHGGNIVVKGDTPEETAKIRELQKALGLSEGGLIDPTTVAAVNKRLEGGYTATYIASNIDDIIELVKSFWTPTRVKVAWGVGIAGALGALWIWKRRRQQSYAPSMSGVFSRGRLRGASLGRTPQQRKFSLAAKSCSGRPGPAFRACMSRSLRG